MCVCVCVCVYVQIISHVLLFSAQSKSSNIRGHIALVVKVIKIV